MITEELSIEELFTVGTTFNKRLYENEYCMIVKSMLDTYPDMDFFVFHENKFEKERGREEVIIKENWDKLHVYDLFELNPWLPDFLSNSPFKYCHTFGTPSTFDPPHYWKRNAIFWFRKVVALHSVINMVKTPFLIWVGADVFWKKPIDDEFLAWVQKFDVCHIDRKLFGLYTETDIMIFNLGERGKYFIDGFLKSYLTHAVFEFDRWDDCIAFDGTKRVLEAQGLRFGSLLDKTGCPFNVYDYLFHWKNPFSRIRDIERGI